MSLKLIFKMDFNSFQDRRILYFFHSLKIIYIVNGFQKDLKSNEMIKIIAHFKVDFIRNSSWNLSFLTRFITCAAQPMRDSDFCVTPHSAQNGNGSWILSAWPCTAGSQWDSLIKNLIFWLENEFIWKHI